MLPYAPVTGPAAGLGALLGPTASLALIATLIALGVLVVSLVMEGRELTARRRMSDVRRIPAESRRAA